MVQQAIEDRHGGDRVPEGAAARNRARTFSLGLLRHRNDARLRRIESRLAAIDAAILALIKSDPGRAGRFTILVSVPGIAAVPAAMLATEMPEPGSLDPGQAAARAGLAPLARP